jgi:serine/threonine protein kinase/flagellin-specific chaperone FliS
MTRNYSTEVFRTPQSRASADDPRVVPAVKEYLAALETGKPMSRHEFLARHAEIADELAMCLDALDVLHAAGDLRPGAVGSVDYLLTENRHLPLGDFRILREIGRGGMGIVYEATQLSLARRVALKVLPFVASLDPIRLQRFKNEAHAAAQLHHTNIVPVYAVGAERGVHFYAMQLIEGHALSTLIYEMRRARGSDGPEAGSDTGGSLARVDPPVDPGSKQPGREDGVDSLDEQAARRETRTIGSTVLTAENPQSIKYLRNVARIVHQAALALEHAHSFGVIHRDIKPANLILDGRGNIWITDFGLALFQAEAQLTLTGDMLGTLRYMSPEQAEGDRVVLDHRTDIYSLGITLYELLTLEPAFGGSDRQLLLQRIKGDEPSAPRSVDERIPRELETIVLKAIAKAPRDRYASAQQFADDLERWLEDKPILARRPTLLERAARWRRQHRALVLSALGFLLLSTMMLLASTIVVLREHTKTRWAYERETAQRVVADESLRQARHAVDAFIDLEEQELANRPSLYQVRRQFLQTAYAYYQDFLDQRHGDASVRAELAATADRVARIVEELSVLSGFGPLTMLTDARVQQDLDLSESDVEKVEQILRQLPEEWEEFKLSDDKLSQEARQKQLAEFLRSKERSIVEVLTPEQIGRLRQIAWQQRGPIAFKYPEVVSALSLSRSQREKINELIDQDRPSGPPGPPDDHRGFDRHGSAGHGPGAHGPDGHGPDSHRPPDGHHKKEGKPPDFHGGETGRPGFHGDGPPRKPPPDQGKRAGTVRRITELLTAEQQAKWQVMTGQPFPHDLHWAPGEWLPH